VNIHKKFVVFDFDGVVCDSTDECMLTSWNAWEKWELRNNFRNDLSEFTEDDKLSFRKVRPRVRGAGEYYILRRAIFEKVSVDNQAYYDKLRHDWEEYLTPFKGFFLAARRQLQKDNIDAWIDLHYIFEDAIEVIKKLNEHNRLYIATLKDAESVKLILEKQGVNIPNGNLLDQATIKSKLQALDHIRKKNNCTKNDIIFIDDNVMHLLEPHNAGYNVFLTGWGQVLNEYIDIAKINKIQLLDECTKLLN